MCGFCISFKNEPAPPLPPACNLICVPREQLLILYVVSQTCMIAIVSRAQRKISHQVTKCARDNTLVWLWQTCRAETAAIAAVAEQQSR
jgi:hypothetical protein